MHGASAPKRPHGRRATSALAAAAGIVAAAIVAHGPAPAARAGQSDMRAARARYPVIVGTVLDSCSLCHVGERDYRLDPYGRDYSRNGRDFGAIEALDSDGDGWSNVDEISALSFPGKADSTPAATSPATSTATSTATATPMPGTDTPTASPSSTSTATEARPPTATATPLTDGWILWLPLATHGGDARTAG